MVFLFQVTKSKTETADVVKTTQLDETKKQNWTNQNLPAIGYALSSKECRDLSIAKCEVLYKNDAADKNAFRLIVYSKGGNALKTLDVTVNESAKSDEMKYTVTKSEDLINVGYSTAVTRIKEATNLNKVDLKKPDLQVNVPYKEVNAEFKLTLVPFGNSEEATANQVYLGSTYNSAFALTQDNVLSNAKYTSAINAVTDELGKLYNASENQNTAYLSETEVGKQTGFLLKSIISACNGPENAAYFLIAPADTRYDALIPGHQTDNIQGATVSYYLVLQDMDIHTKCDTSRPVTAVLGSGLNNFGIEKLPDNIDPAAVYFVYKNPETNKNSIIKFKDSETGEMTDHQDGEKAGVPSNITIEEKNEKGKLVEKTMKIVSTIPGETYSYKGNDGTVQEVARSVKHYDGETQVEVNGKMVTPKEGMYNVYTAMVYDEATEGTKEMIVAQQIYSSGKESAFPKGITRKTGDREQPFVLESIPDLLNEKHIKVTLINLPLTTVGAASGEELIKPFAEYMNIKAGDQIYITANKTYFNLAKDNKTFTDLKKDELVKSVLGQIPAYMLSPQ